MKLTHPLWGLCLLAAAPAIADTARLQETLVPAQAPAKRSEAEQLREQMKQMHADFEAQMQRMEQRLQQVEAQQAQASEPAPAAAASSNAMNPQISVILAGSYQNLSQDPRQYRTQGFIPGGDAAGPGTRSFSLGESEMTLSANIDPQFYGQVTFSVAPDNSISAEEAFLRTIGLGDGLTVKAGRFFSETGYLNTQHAHAWDFSDAPLVYQAFFGGQYKTEGVQATWLAPLDRFVQIGAELGNGHEFPGNDRNKNGVGATTLFAAISDDIGDSASWKASLSWLHNAARARDYVDTDSTGTGVVDSFTGATDTWNASFVYKWSPNGNATQTNLKLQGEYFQRRDDGSLAYDTLAASAGPLFGDYRATQAGWYVQGVYQFMPQWRVGLRYDQLLGGARDIALVQAGLLPMADFPRLDGFNPSRSTLMVDYSPSEFSRFRLQFANDKSRPAASDNEIILQYIVSLGTHGAHTF